VIDGAGKTILLFASSTVPIWMDRFNMVSRSLAIDQLQKSRLDSAGVAFIFFNRKQHQDRSVADFVTALTRQLVKLSEDISEPIMHSYELHKENKTRPSLEEYQKILAYEINRFKTAYIVMDAADECGAQIRLTLFQILSEIQKSSPHVRILVSSRIIDSIAADLEGATELVITAQDMDIGTYIENQSQEKVGLRKLTRSHPTLLERMKGVLISKADGMCVSAYPFPFSQSDGDKVSFGGSTPTTP
jgi:ABC-type transporter Mla MlaB component